MCILSVADKSLGCGQVIATLCSGLLGAVLILLWSVVTERSKERRESIAALTRTTEVALAHPELEDEELTNSWSRSVLSSRNVQDEECKFKRSDFIRYDIYCILLKNALERAWRAHGKKLSNLDKKVGIDEILVTHLKWMRDPGNIPENLEGYEKKFEDELTMRTLQLSQKMSNETTIPLSKWDIEAEGKRS